MPPSTSPTSRPSGTPPRARAAAASSGSAPGASREYRFGAQRRVAERCQRSGDLLVAGVVPGHVVYHDDATHCGRLRRSRQISLDRVPVRAGNRDGPCLDRVAHRNPCPDRPTPHGASDPAVARRTRAPAGSACPIRRPAVAGPAQSGQPGQISGAAAEMVLQRRRRPAGVGLAEGRTGRKVVPGGTISSMRSRMSLDRPTSSAPSRSPVGPWCGGR